MFGWAASNGKSPTPPPLSDIDPTGLADSIDPVVRDWLTARGKTLYMDADSIYLMLEANEKLAGSMLEVAGLHYDDDDSVSGKSKGEGGKRRHLDGVRIPQLPTAWLLGCLARSAPARRRGAEAVEHKAGEVRQ